MIGLKLIKQLSILEGRTDTSFMYKGMETLESLDKKAKLANSVAKLQVNI